MAGGELFRIDITLTNTSASPATDVRYARTLDWDVPPGHFSDDFTTTNGGALSVGPGNRVFHTSSNPFDVPDPMVTRSQDANTNINDEPGDLGSYFIFSFGDLLAGESKTFTTFIGGALSTAALLNAFAAQNVEAFSYTYDDDGTATFGYGFTGLGIPPVIGGAAGRRSSGSGRPGAAWPRHRGTGTASSEVLKAGFSRERAVRERAALFRRPSAILVVQAGRSPRRHRFPNFSQLEPGSTHAYPCL